jgi:hypothetical protein
MKPARERSVPYNIFAFTSGTPNTEFLPDYGENDITFMIV